MNFLKNCQHERNHAPINERIFWAVRKFQFDISISLHWNLKSYFPQRKKRETVKHPRSCSPFLWNQYFMRCGWISSGAHISLAIPAATRKQKILITVISFIIYVFLFYLLLLYYFTDASDLFQSLVLFLSSVECDWCLTAYRTWWLQ